MYVHYSLTKNSVVYTASEHKATGHKPVASRKMAIKFTVLQYGGLNIKFLRQHKVQEASL
jgi:hypothetical protein